MSLIVPRLHEDDNKGAPARRGGTLPSVLLSLLVTSALLAWYCIHSGHLMWAEGLLIGMAISAVHNLSWTLILGALVPTPKLFHRRFVQGIALKILFVYLPLIWIVGEPPMLGLFALLGFTGVLFAAALDRTRMLPRVLPLSPLILVMGFLTIPSSPSRAVPSRIAGSAASPVGFRDLGTVDSSHAMWFSSWLAVSALHGPTVASHGAPIEHRDSSRSEETKKTEKKHVELPTFGRWAQALFPNSPLARILGNPHVERAIWTLFVTLSLAFLIAWVARHAAFHPGRLQAAMELSIQWIVELLATILPDKEAKQFLPFIGGLFLYILAVNLSGLVPLAAPGTTFIAMTAGLAACTFLTVQYMAFTRLGPLRYLYHLAGEPADRVTWAMSPLMVVLHLVEELAKPVTLSVRLFGNVFAEHTLLAVMAVLGVGALSVIHSPVGLPFELPFMFLALLTGSIQALVFAVLTAVYIALVLPHED